MNPTEEQLKNRLIGAGLNPTSPGGVIAPQVPTTLNSSNLTPTSAITLPTPTPDTNNYAGILAGAQAQLKAIQDSVNSMTTVPETPTETAKEPSWYQKLLNQLKPPEAPTNSASNYSNAYNEVVTPIQNELNAKTTVTKNAQSKLANINAQLGALSAESTAVPIANQEQFKGTGATVAGVAPITVSQQRQIALRALPLQAQAVAAQAEVASAQGDEQLAQNLLTQATTKLDKLFTLQSQDIQNKFEYDMKVYNSIKGDLTKAEEKELASLEEERKNKFTLDLEAVKQENEIAKIKLQDSNDIAKIRLQESLKTTPTLGVDLAPGQQSDLKTVVTLNGKPMTDAQATSYGFAQRLNDANSTITELGGKFTGIVSSLTGSPYFPNIFKTGDRQMYEQAQRNFINAILRKESGAAISPSEFDSAAKQYFPQPGDGQEVINQKTVNRNRAISNLAQSANVSLETIKGSSASGGDYNAYLKAIGQ